MSDDKSARERWKEWEERSGYEREKGGGGSAAAPVKRLSKGVVLTEKKYPTGEGHDAPYRFQSYSRHEVIVSHSGVHKGAAVFKGGKWQDKSPHSAFGSLSKQDLDALNEHAPKGAGDIREKKESVPKDLMKFLDDNPVPARETPPKDFDMMKFLDEDAAKTKAAGERQAAAERSSSSWGRSEPVRQAAREYGADEHAKREREVAKHFLGFGNKPKVVDDLEAAKKARYKAWADAKTGKTKRIKFHFESRGGKPAA